MDLQIPQKLVDAARDGARRHWVSSLPARVALIAEEWNLEVGDPYQPGGVSAWVAPARSATHGDVALKVAWRHYEADHEAAGLREWDGVGTVRLHESTDLALDTVALLLERCTPGTTLSHRAEEEQDEVVAGLLRRLWKRPPPGHPFRPLQSMCDAWADEFEQKLAIHPLPLDASLIRKGIDLLRSLPSSTDEKVLLCTDLHAGNILAARREPWLVIDPKPYVGDRAYDVLQHMLNCQERLESDPIWLVHRMGQLCDLDSQHVTLWLFARCIQESLDSPHLAEIARRIASHL